VAMVFVPELFAVCPTLVFVLLGTCGTITAEGKKQMINCQFLYSKLSAKNFPETRRKSITFKSEAWMR
jgi:hypothetical protein